MTKVEQEREPVASPFVTLMLTGDVMTGRGIDQVLPHAGDATIFERHARSATSYVELAEQAHGPIPRPVSFDYVWGDSLSEMRDRAPDVRLVNLETAVTTSARPEPKGINYKMHPANVPVIGAAAIDCCVLANNHVMDWGEAGLLETLETLAAAGVATAGAGREIREAAAPAMLEVQGRARVLVFALGSPTSGVPRAWAATASRAGVNLLPDLSIETVQRIGDQVRTHKASGDIAIASLHWGGNWGHDIPDDQVAFAHGLVDHAGIDVVHGHSSHHPKAIEVYRDRLVLYGCGDFIDDYEGITGYEEFRDDLVLMYLAKVRAGDGALAELTAIPFRTRRFRLERARPEDASWLARVLGRECARFGTRLDVGPGSELIVGKG